MKEEHDELGRDLIEIQREIEDLETVYLEGTGSKGNLLQGFGRYLIHRTMKYNKKPQKVEVHDYQRLFSLSSCTSRVSKALGDDFERFSIMHMHMQQDQSELQHHGKLLSPEEPKSDLFHSDSQVLSSSEQPSKRFQARPALPRRPKKKITKSHAHK